MISDYKELLKGNTYTIWYRLQLLSLILVAATLPFSILLNNIAIGCVVLTWLISGNYKAKLQKALKNNLFLLFVSVFVVQVVGLLYTSEVSEGLGKIERKAALFILPLILLSANKLSFRHITFVVKVFVIACLGLASYALIYILIDYGSFQNVPALTETIDELTNVHHAYSGMYIVFAVAASVYVVFSKEVSSGKSDKILFFCIAIFLYAFLIILAARTAVFTSFLLAAIMLISNLRLAAQKRYLIAAVLFCTTLTIAVVSFPNTRSKIAEFYELRGVHSPITPRLIKWKCCFTILNEKDAWLFGVGTGDAQKHLQQCYSDEKFWGELYELNAHNEYLEEMVRHGVLGLSIFLISVLYPFALSIQRKKSLYLIFLFVFMISSFTESTLSRQKGVVFYALFNSILAFSYLTESKVVGSGPKNLIKA